MIGTGNIFFTSRVYDTNPFPMSVDIHVVTLAECDLSDSCHRPILSVSSWFEAVFRESQVKLMCARPDC